MDMGDTGNGAMDSPPTWALPKTRARVPGRRLLDPGGTEIGNSHRLRSSFPRRRESRGVERKWRGQGLDPRLRGDDRLGAPGHNRRKRATAFPGALVRTPSGSGSLRPWWHERPLPRARRNPSSANEISQPVRGLPLRSRPPVAGVTRSARMCCFLVADTGPQWGGLDDGPPRSQEPHAIP